jgi:uncharacterized SAM-binding protein YcdF (DUF218 family)
MRSHLFRFLAAVLILAVGWFGWSGYTIWVFGTRDFAKPSDCAVVLGAGTFGADPSPVFEQRIKHGIGLHRRGVVSKIVFTGGQGEGAAHAESEVAARYALRAGVQQDDILIETRSRTTRQNLTEAKALMDAASLVSAVIVSDPLHLKRASIMAKDLKMAAVTSPTATSRYRSATTRLGFLLREIYFLHHYRLTGH